MSHVTGRMQHVKFLLLNHLRLVPANFCRAGCPLNGIHKTNKKGGGVNRSTEHLDINATSQSVRLVPDPPANKTSVEHSACSSTIGSFPSKKPHQWLCDAQFPSRSLHGFQTVFLADDHALGQRPDSPAAQLSMKLLPPGQFSRQSLLGIAQLAAHGPQFFGTLLGAL